MVKRATGKPDPKDDSIYLPPKYYAMQALAGLVSNPPVDDKQLQADLDYPHLERSTQLWLNWFDAHKDELGKLEPTGEGVDFSASACKDGKPVKKIVSPSPDKR